ncbi:EpsG family protein [Pediococcus acidilactici]|uniref:EpsG family protein n=1 Tax=Pediococcus acidilactici TaxID=1254 RepID=UPI001058E8BB|nr:EpsG family protein [Pediococcus acidilactici]KAF0514937.1 hypothetical protein GBP29_09560 [Pediococcus acidilactici]MCT3036810.1 EpsG family protein [Pediococcus acidilactici]QQC45230.1 EpsG family protein [Pediococcus acidilactici]
MKTYIIAISISIVITIASKVVKTNYAKNVLRLTSILPLAVIAGVRDSTIGTDISNYGLANFVAATHFNNLVSYLSYIKSLNGVEVGYSILNFVVSRFTSSINVFFFVLNLLTILFVFLAFSEKHEEKNFLMGIAIYYLLFWDSSLNVMRQSLAASIVLYGVVLLINRKKTKTFLLLIMLAASFHQTAILAVTIPLFLWMSKRNSKLLNYSIFFVGGFFIYIILSPKSNLITIAMQSVPLLGKYYSIFLQAGMQYVSTGAGMSVKTIFIRILPMIISIIYLALARLDDDYFIENKEFFINIMILSIAFEFVNMNSGVFARLGMYYSILQVILYPRLINTLKLNSLKFLAAGLLILYLAGAAYIRITAGYGEIYPYTSNILENFVWKWS